MKPCSDCDGLGTYFALACRHSTTCDCDGPEVTCPTCKGSGEVIDEDIESPEAAE